MNNLNPEIEEYIVEQFRVKGVDNSFSKGYFMMLFADEYSETTIKKHEFIDGVFVLKKTNVELINFLICQFIIPETLEEFKIICQILKVWQ